MTSEDFSHRSFEELLVEEERPTFRRCTAAVMEIGLREVSEIVEFIRHALLPWSWS